MCGIVGLFLKDRKLDSKLGGLLSDMLVTMSDRGPDSAGIAVYGKPTRGQIKITVQSPLAAGKSRKGVSSPGMNGLTLQPCKGSEAANFRLPSQWRNVCPGNPPMKPELTNQPDRASR